MNWLLFAEALITLLIMINPINVIPTYLSLTKDLQKEERRHILKQAMVFAMLILIICVFIGRTVLIGLGIETFALQIAGGILFFKFGYEVMTGSLEIDNDQSPGLVPLGFPIIAGPGSITAIILLSTQYEIVDIYEIYLVSAIIVVLVITFLFLYSAKSVVNLLGNDATTAIVKLMGLLVITIGIQLVLSGIQSWILSNQILVGN